MRKSVVFGLFIAASIVVGVFSGVSNLPGEWYQSLQKPVFNPPPWIFAPVWTILYGMIGGALAATWYDENNGRRLIVFAIQAVLNLLWSPAFFGMHSPALGLALILPMLAFILLFVALSWRPNRTAALLFVPYALWVAFASLLNLSIVLLN